MKEPTSCSEVPLLQIAECSEAVSVLTASVSACWFCAHATLWASASALQEHQEHRSTRRRRAAALNQCRRNAPLLPVLQEDQIYPYPSGVFYWSEQKKQYCQPKILSLVRPLGVLQIAYCSLLSICSWTHALYRRYSKWGPKLMPSWAVSLTRQCASHGLPVGLSQRSPGNTLFLLGSLEEHSPSPHVTGNGASFAVFCWFCR